MSSMARFADVKKALRRAVLGVLGWLMVAMQTAAIAQSTFVPDPPPPPSLIESFAYGVGFCYGPPTDSYLSNTISLSPGKTVDTYACPGFYPTSSLCTETLNFTGTDLYTGTPYYGGQYIPGAISSVLTPNQLVFAQDPSGPIQSQRVIVPATVTLTSKPLPPMAPGIPGTYTPSYYLVFTANANAPECYGTPGYDGPINISEFAVTILNVTLIDPIADGLSSGTGIVSDPTALMGATHIVQGVAADNASQVLVRVIGMQLGDTVQLTLSDENGPSSDGAGTGYLTSLPVGGADSRTSNGVINIGAVDAGNGSAVAFAVYHAPSDFVRAGNTSDPTSKLRNVTIQATYTATSSLIAQASASVTQSVSVVRPPVILVHGLWGTPSDFSGADGGVLGALESSGLFTVSFGRYDNSGMGISSSNPTYNVPGVTPLGASGNALGFQFGAQTVLPQIVGFINAYKTVALILAAGPDSGPIAAVQADIVAHSMGGNVTRTLPQLAEYAAQQTYGVGYVHKLITIDTPHQGAKLAAAILDPRNSCVESMLAFGGNYSFSSVVTTDGRYITGAMGDLQPGSDALVATHTGSNVIPTAMIGAQMTTAQRNGAGKTGAGRLIAIVCGTFSDPLAIELTPLYWPDVAGSATDPSDAIVPLSSQFDGEQATYPVANPAASVYGIHSKGPEQLGFLPPTVLDQASCAGQTSCAPTEVINLLNTPVSTITAFEAKP